MKKKLLVAVLAATAAICSAFGLSACDIIPDSGSNGNDNEKHTHNYGTAWITDKDNHWHECANDGCDEKIKDEAAHTDTDEDGKCDVCKYEISDGVITSEHKLIPVAETVATCTTNGNIAYYICGDCGKWYSDKGGKNEIIDKSSVVTFKELILVSANSATCTTEGNSAYYICDDCGKWYSDKGGKNEIKDKTSVILPKGHKVTLVSEKEETCTTDGNIAYYTCSGCDKWFEDRYGENEITDKTSVVIEKKGHKLTLEEEKSVTCTADGNIAYYSCSNCSNWYSDNNGENQIKDKASVIIVKGHRFDCGFCQICSQPQPPTQGLRYITVGSICAVAGTGTSTDTDIVIPTTYNGQQVTHIAIEAFLNCRNLTSIFIPKTIVNIGQNAFFGCWALTIYCETTKKPESWSEIWNSSVCPVVWDYKNNNVADNGCIYTVKDGIRYSLKEDIAAVDEQSTDISGRVAIPQILEYRDSTYEVKSIIYNAFESNSVLTEVTIPNSVISIGDYAFYNCINLTDINFNGTKAQWNAIEKGKDWNYNTGEYTVHCTDGDIAKSLN